VTSLFKKLNFKDHDPIVILQSTDTFKPEMVEMSQWTSVLENWVEITPFVLTFLKNQAELDEFAQTCATQTEGDAVIWVAYPKKSSKRYKCDFNRDTGFFVFGKFGFEPVRMVAIDDDWSALRMRRVDFIKTMTRSFAMTEKGKEKAGI
jgi:hypothetical protein